jgi:hypothetical protein
MITMRQDKRLMYRDLRDEGWGRWRAFRVAYGLISWRRAKRGPIA